MTSLQAALLKKKIEKSFSTRIVNFRGLELLNRLQHFVKIVSRQILESWGFLEVTLQRLASDEKNPDGLAGSSWRTKVEMTRHSQTARPFSSFPLHWQRITKILRNMYLLHLAFFFFFFIIFRYFSTTNYSPSSRNLLIPEMCTSIILAHRNGCTMIMVKWWIICQMRNFKFS